MGLNHKAQQLLEKAVKKHPGNASFPFALSPSITFPPPHISSPDNAPLLVNLASNLEPSSPPSNATSDRALLLFGRALQADPSLMEAYALACCTIYCAAFLTRPHSYTNRAAVFTTRKECATTRRLPVLSPVERSFIAGLTLLLLTCSGLWSSVLTVPECKLSQRDCSLMWHMAHFVTLCHGRYTGIGNAMLSLQRSDDALAAFNQARSSSTSGFLRFF